MSDRVTHRRVVLILGAGASIPYGFPSGHALKQLAARPDAALQQRLEMVGFGRPAIVQFSEELRRAEARSIDQFLENRPDFEDIGRAAIAAVLCMNEHHSVLYDLERNGRWYHYLFDDLLEVEGVSDLESGQLSIITFNYDRSIEYWLLNRIEAMYGKRPEEAIQVLRQVPIIHVHGVLGYLPGLGDPVREYGAELTPVTLRSAMTGIRIVHEENGQSDAFSHAHRVLKQAEHVVFLGFGYLERNVQRLRLSQTCYRRFKMDASGETTRMMSARGIPDSATIHGTALDRTDQEKRRIRRLFQDVGGITLAGNETDVHGCLRSSHPLFLAD